MHPPDCSIATQVGIAEYRERRPLTSHAQACDGAKSRKLEKDTESCSNLLPLPKVFGLLCIYFYSIYQLELCGYNIVFTVHVRQAIVSSEKRLICVQDLGSLGVSGSSSSLVIIEAKLN